MNTEKSQAIEGMESRLVSLTEESPEYLNLCIQLGDAHTDSFILSDAVVYYRRALDIAVKQNNRVEEARLLSRLAAAHGRSGKYHEALEHDLKALSLLEQNGDENKNSALYATILGNTGLAYHGISILDSAHEYFLRALKLFEKLNDGEGATRQYINIGLLYADMGDTDAALEALKKALSKAQNSPNKRHIASIFSSIANVYYLIDDFGNALEFNHNALAYAVESNAKDYQASIIGNIGVIYMKQGIFGKAYEYFSQALAINEELGKIHGIVDQYANLASVSIGEKNYDKALGFITQAVQFADESNLPEQICLAHGGLGVLYSEQDFEKRDTRKAIHHLQLAVSLIENHGLTLQNGEYYKKLSEVYAELNDGMNAYNAHKQYSELRERLYNEEVTNRAKQFGFERKLTAEKARTQEHENILNKTFPTQIARRLLANETFIADYYESVSVIFMDVVNFTPLASKIPPKMVVNLLNIIFTKADEVMNEFGLEKIKTIGDAYMAICGAPVLRHDHALRTASAALKLRSEMKTISAYFHQEFGSQDWFPDIIKLEVRIGVHCGEAVGGVIGSEKLAYDLWGDAVNTAARMESHGEAGKIHVSEEFAKTLMGESSLKDTLTHLESAGMRTLERGELDIKGKGKMKTYFLEEI